MTQTRAFDTTKIRKAREKKGLSAKLLAEILGISRPHLTRIERGYRGITPALAMRLEEVLDIPKESIHPDLWRY
jgi:transcriptional regulator with XRE-family HTH domain